MPPVLPELLTLLLSTRLGTVAKCCNRGKLGFGSFVHLPTYQTRLIVFNSFGQKKFAISADEMQVKDSDSNSSVEVDSDGRE